VPDTVKQHNVHKIHASHIIRKERKGVSVKVIVTFISCFDTDCQNLKFLDSVIAS